MAPAPGSGRGTLLGAARGRVLGTVRGYVALTKPRIIELLLVTTLPPMILAAQGFPSWWLVVATLVGGSCAAGSANTINCYLDRDIDKVMHRTRRRPLAASSTAEGGAPGAAIAPVNALRFGLALGAGATLLLGFAVNWPSALLADGAIAVYVFVYTLGLKRRTPSNIVIGGAAGCFPAVIGWSAVTGTVGWQALVLFAVVFFWTPPHFWALAMRFRDDYAAAGVPMLPVVATAGTVARRILLYSYGMVAISLLLVPAEGWIYGGVALAAGAWFLLEAHRLLARVGRGEDPRPMRLFHQSISYLTVLFLAVAVVPFLH